MLGNNPWNSYKEIAFQTAHPAQLVLMLYEGAIRFMEQAHAAFEKQDDPIEFNQGVCNNLLRAQAIINELNLSLNMEQGGEVSENFRNLYNYFDRRLQESNISKEPEGIDEVISKVTELRDAWSQMMEEQGLKVEASTPLMAGA